MGQHGEWKKDVTTRDPLFKQEEIGMLGVNESCRIKQRQTDIKEKHLLFDVRQQGEWRRDVVTRGPLFKKEEVGMVGVNEICRIKQRQTEIKVLTV